MIKKLAPIVEQLILSGLSLLINIAFIAVSSKEEFGIFSILNSYLLLAVSLQTAIFSVPVTVEIARFTEEEKKRSLITSSWAVLPIAMFLSAISALVLYIYFRLNQHENVVSTCIAFAAAIFTTWIREFSRTLNVLQGQLMKSLKLAIIYSAIISAAIAFCVLTEKKLTSVEVFFFIAISALISSPDLIKNLRNPVSVHELQQIKKLLTPHSKWAAPGVFTSWLQNNAYLSIVGGLAGISATADLAAARLFIMPYMTGFSGLSRTLVKRFSENFDDIPSQINKKATALAGIQIILGLCLAFIFYIINNAKASQLLGNYARSLDLAVWWAVFSGIACGKSVLVMLAQAARKFRLLFGTNVVAATAVLVLLFVPLPIDITKLAIFALIVGETVTLAIVWDNLRKASNIR